MSGPYVSSTSIIGSIIYGRDPPAPKFSKQHSKVIQSCRHQVLFTLKGVYALNLQYVTGAPVLYTVGQ